MRIVTWNVNGLRAALRKGFPEHLEALSPDVLLMQEIRVTPEQLPGDWASPPGWHVLWHPARRLGYAGTAIWSRYPIEEIGRGVLKTDPDGRLVLARTGGVRVASVYLPSGSSSEDRQAAKERWMRSFFPWARATREAKEPLVLGGDLNIAHTERDIFYAKGNAKNSGFLPHERAWFGRLLKQGWADTTRQAAGEVQGPYSWWSNRGRARTLDRGWRIDYLLANPAAERRITGAWIHRPGGLEVSDHAPVVLDLEG